MAGLGSNYRLILLKSWINMRQPYSYCLSRIEIFAIFILND